MPHTVESFLRWCLPVGVCLTEAGESIPPRGASLLLRWQGFSLGDACHPVCHFPAPMPQTPPPGQLVRLPAQPCGPWCAQPSRCPGKRPFQRRSGRSLQGEAAACTQQAPLANPSEQWIAGVASGPAVRGAFTCLCRRGWWLHPADFALLVMLHGCRQTEVTWLPSRA